MKQHKAPNTRNPKSFTTAAILDATVQVDDNAASFVPSADEVALRAYLKFQSQGAPDGYDVEHWLSAETELIAEHDVVGR